MMFFLEFFFHLIVPSFPYATNFKLFFQRLLFFPFQHLNPSSLHPFRLYLFHTFVTLHRFVVSFLSFYPLIRARIQNTNQTHKKGITAYITSRTRDLAEENFFAPAEAWDPEIALKKSQTLSFLSLTLFYIFSGYTLPPPMVPPPPSYLLPTFSGHMGLSR